MPKKVKEYPYMPRESIFRQIWTGVKNKFSKKEKRRKAEMMEALMESELRRQREEFLEVKRREWLQEQAEFREMFRAFDEIEGIDLDDLDDLATVADVDITVDDVVVLSQISAERLESEKLELDNLDDILDSCKIIRSEDVLMNRFGRESNRKELEKTEELSIQYIKCILAEEKEVQGVQDDVLSDLRFLFKQQNTSCMNEAAVADMRYVLNADSAEIKIQVLTGVYGDACSEFFADLIQTVEQEKIPEIVNIEEAVENVENGELLEGENVAVEGGEVQQDVEMEVDVQEGAHPNEHDILAHGADTIEQEMEAEGGDNSMERGVGGEDASENINEVGGADASENIIDVGGADASENINDVGGADASENINEVGGENASENINEVGRDNLDMLEADEVVGVEAGIEGVVGGEIEVEEALEDDSEDNNEGGEGSHEAGADVVGVEAGIDGAVGGEIEVEGHIDGDVGEAVEVEHQNEQHAVPQENRELEFSGDDGQKDNAMRHQRVKQEKDETKEPQKGRVLLTLNQARRERRKRAKQRRKRFLSDNNISGDKNYTKSRQQQ